MKIKLGVLKKFKKLKFWKKISNIKFSRRFLIRNAIIILGSTILIANYQNCSQQSALSGSLTALSMGGSASNVGPTSTPLPTSSPGPTPVTNCVPSSAVKLGWMVQPSNTTVGTVMNPFPQVGVFDANDNLVTCATNPVTITSSSPAQPILAQSINMVNGEGRLAITTNLVGTFTMAASSTGLTSATSNSFTVSPAHTTNTVTSMGLSYDGACINNKGRLQCFGGQPSQGTVNGVAQVVENYIYNPTSLANTSGLTNVTAVAGSELAFCAVNNGGVQCWGSNSNNFGGPGDLGSGTTTDSINPVQVTGLSTGVASVAGDQGGFCALTNTGTVSCWGVYSITSTFNSNLTPVAVSGLPAGITAISGDEDGYCAIAGNTVSCWGPNLAPQTIKGYTGQITAFSGSLTEGCLVAGGTAYCWAADNNGISTQAVAISGLNSGVTAIANSRYTACAVQNGKAFCWGADNFGLYGNGTNINYSQSVNTNIITTTTPVPVTGLNSGVTSVYTNYFNSYALMNGHLYSWGATQGLGNATVINSLNTALKTYSAIPVGVTGY